jgi:RNA polymerase sigma factor (sigma-70 family)
VRDKEEAKDIVQDVFLKAYSSWSKVPDEATARNFLYVIARQRMIDLWRSAKHRLQGELSSKNGSDNLLAEYLGEDFDSLSGDEKLPEDIFQDSENRQYVVELFK